MKYRKKPVIIEAITFDELVAHGIQQCTDAGVPLVGGMPVDFTYQGHPITYEDDNCYFVPTLEGFMRFERNAMLITGVKGEIYPCRLDVFEKTYEPVAEDGYYPTPVKPEPVRMLERLLEKVERANCLQHSGGEIDPADWAELFMLQNEARGVLERHA